MVDEDEHPGRIAALLGRGVLSVGVGASRGLDLLILARAPALASVYLALWRARHRSSPFVRDGRFRARLAAASAGADARTLTYGFTPVHVARRLLRWAGVGPEALVYDAGAGRGEVLLAARALGARARGRELVARHVEVAGPALARVGATLEAGDAAEDDLTGVTHVFAAWTVFSPSARARLERGWRALAPGARVLTFAAPLTGPQFDRLGVKTVWVPWGLEQAFLHERRG